MRQKILTTAFILGLGGTIMAVGYSQTEARTNDTHEVVAETIEPTKSFETQVMDDIVARYESEKEEREEVKEMKKAKAPYNFLSLDDTYQIYLEKRCKELNINFFLAASLMFSESSFKPSAVGDSGNSIGLFQINKCNWERMEYVYGLDVSRPLENIDAGLRIMRELMNDYPDDVAAVIQCYKCGIGRGEELMKEGVYLSCIDEIVNRAIEWQNEAEKENEPSTTQD